MIPYQVYEMKALMENPFINFIMLKGAGGVGKTKTIAEYLKEYGYAPYQYLFLGPTGKSVSVAEEKGLHGSTLHRWFKILTSSTIEDINTRILNSFGSFKNYHQYIKLKLKDIEVIFIDEISMINNEILGFMLVTLSEIKPHLKIVLAGDYHQLPSVITNISKNKNLTSSLDIIQGLICSREMGVVDFITRYRSEDDEFNEFLHYLRQGTFQKPKEISDMIRKFCNVYDGELPDDLKHKLSYLHYINDKVKGINDSLLRELPGNEYSYNMNIVVDRYPATKSEERDLIVKQFQLDFVVNFKEGSKILFRVNDPAGQFKNGDEGIIEQVKKDGRIIVKKMTVWGDSLIEVNKHKYVTTEEEKQEGFDIEIHQYPFSLGTARTYHKAQGDGFLHLHLDFEFLENNYLFEETKWQYLYVGLSRIIDPKLVWIPERSLKALERQYSLFKRINYDKLCLNFDSPHLVAQEYLPRIKTVS